MSINPTTIRAKFWRDDPLGIVRFGWSASTQRYFAQSVHIELAGADDLQLFRTRIRTAQGVASLLFPWVTLSDRTIRALERDRLIAPPAKQRGR